MKQSFTAILSLIIFFSGTAFSQEKSTLSGKITDAKSGDPLASATVSIPDLQITVIADSLGYYAFRSLPSGSYLVEVRYIGHKSVTRNLNITGSLVADFALPENTVEESEVVITGLSKATQIKRSPVPIISVSHDYLEKNLSTNIIDAIAKIPGISALSTGANVAKPFIRGLGYNRVLTLFDGIRQEGQQWGDEHGVEVDQYSIEKIEVIKGPASLSYGSDALAGVVNFIPYKPASEGKKIGDVILEYQTNNGMLGGSAMLGAAKNGLEWKGRITHKQAQDYRNKIDERVYNTAFNETDANIALGLHSKWGYSHLNFSLYNNLQEIPDGSRDSVSRKFTRQITEEDNFRPIVPEDVLTSYAISDLHQHVQHYRVYSGNSFRMGESRIGVNLGFQKSIRKEFSHPQYPDIPGLDLELNTLSYDVKYYLPQLDGWNLSIGANGMYQSNNVARGTEFVIPAYRQFDLGLFALLKKTFDKLDIAGGLRYDYRFLKSESLFTIPAPVTGFDQPVYGSDTLTADKLFPTYSHRFSGVSGSIGVTYNFNDKISIKANIARGYRAPNISEVTASGVHPGTGVYQLGNSVFQPEFSLQEDLGFSYNSKHIVIDFSIFNNTLSNYIYNQRLASMKGGDSLSLSGSVEFPTYQFRQGKVQLYGGELNMDFHPVKALHFENSISVVYGNNNSFKPGLKTDSNRYVPFIPPLHGTSEVQYDFDIKSHHLVNGFIKIQLAYYAAQNRVYLLDNTETPTPGYALFNAGAGIGITNKKGQVVCNFYLMGNNLFNIAYQDHLSRLKYFEPYPEDPRGFHGIYNMGRNLGLKINIPLIF